MMSTYYAHCYFQLLRPKLRVNCERDDQLVPTWRPIFYEHGVPKAI